MNENIQKLLKELDIKVALNPYNTIVSYVSFSKDLVKKVKLSGFIYQVSFVVIAVSFVLEKQNGV